MILSQAIQITAILLAGLVAGLFYAYECSVTGGLGKLPDREYLTAFQSINKVILNPYFFASFMGCVFVLPLASWLSYHAGAHVSFYFMLSATVVYLVGVFGVTVVSNVPLNEALANFNVDTSSAEEIRSLRDRFESPWNKYNLIRTVAAIASFLLTILSIVKFK